MEVLEDESEGVGENVPPYSEFVLEGVGEFVGLGRFELLSLGYREGEGL
jgi:hypothetical protein